VISIPSETHTISKIALFVGIAFVLIAAFNPSAGAAWTNFQNSVHNFPQFNNPFTQTTLWQVTPTEPWKGGSFHTAPSSTVGTDNGCSNTAWWNCVYDSGGTDLNRTYAVLANPYPSNVLIVNLSSAPLAGTIAFGSATIWCRSETDTPQPISVAIGQSTSASLSAAIVTTYGYDAVCKPGPFQQLTVNLELAESGTPYDLAVAAKPNFVISIIAIEPNNSTAWARSPFDISTVRATLYVSGAVASCGGSDFFAKTGCQIAQFFALLSNFGTFVVNGIVFAGQILFYFVNTALQFFALFGYFFGIAGMPPIMQGLLTVLFISISLYIAVAFFGKIRGTGNTG